MISTLLFAAAAALPQLPPVNGTGALGTPKDPSAFTFYVAGDNRPDKGNDPSPAFVEIIEAISTSEPAPGFVLWGGDIIKGKKSSDAKAQYPAVLKLFAKLGVPVFNVPGNHELDKKGSGDCHDAPDPDGKLLKDYVTFVAAQPYGWFQYGNSIFIGIDTEETPGKNHQPSGCFNGYVSPTQLSLIQAKIASVPKGTNVFLFMHRPTQDDNAHVMQPDKEDRDTKYGRAIKAFVKYVNSLTNPNIVYVFASHDHRHYDAVVGSATRTGFVITGGAGAPLSGCPKNCRPGAFYHWLRVDVNGNAVKVTAVALMQP
jgi:3',5'-cyclic AMP phosphodiesterase CpdA